MRRTVYTDPYVSKDHLADALELFRIVAILAVCAMGKSTCIELTLASLGNPVPLYTATGVKPECYTRLRRVGRITVGGVGALSDLVVGSGVVGANAGAGRPRSSSSSRSIPHGQNKGPV